MAFLILQTKLYIPTPRPDAVPRPALVRRLEEGLCLGHRLSLVSAPAGFGKSTLLAEWIAESNRLQAGAHPPRQPWSFTWLSLEKAENDPVRFWGYLGTALDSVFGGVAQPFIQAVRAVPVPAADAPEDRFEEWANAVLVPLLNEVTAQSGPAVLVLDDYHVIENLAIQAGMSFLVEHLPPNLHLVIATRSDPPLPLHRLRARARLTELRAADLRFTLQEAKEFLRDVLGLPVSEEDVRRLEQRTEGWAAGLQMAGLAILALPTGAQGENGQNRVEFIQSFSGSHQYVLDYLAEEVLNRLPAETQAFLLHTSILERFNAELCDALLSHSDTALSEQTVNQNGQNPIQDDQNVILSDQNVIPSDSEGSSSLPSSLPSSSPSTSILSSLERGNLFLIPLDPERTWFRYHHLFAELLRVRLRQSEPQRIAGLHRTAAAWLEEHGWDGEAFDHAVEGQDYRRAGRIVLRNWQRLGHAGLAGQALSWLDKLPREVVQTDQGYPSAYAWMLHVQGRHAEMAPHIDLAARIQERSLAEGRLVPGTYEYREVAGQLAALRGILASRNGDLVSGEMYAHQVLETAPEEHALIRGIAHNMLATILRLRGRLQEAEQEFSRAIRLLREGRNFVAEAIAIYYGARTLVGLGRLHAAQDTCLDGMEAARVRGMERIPAFGMLELALAEVRFEQNRLDEAGQLLEDALRLGGPGGFLELFRQGGVLRARLCQARGDLAGAETILDEARTALRRLNASPAAVAEVNALSAWISLQMGNIPSAEHWANGLAARPAAAPRLDIEAAVLVRFLTETGRAAEALSLLDTTIPTLESGQRRGDLAQFLVLRAAAYNALGQRDKAREELDRALALSQAAGLTHLATQVKPLLETLQPTPVDTPSSPRGAGANQDLVEPLSDREIEILCMMAEGASNRQIAERLYLALGTVKTHVHNVSAKLDAQNRVQAIARAREIGLLD